MAERTVITFGCFGQIARAIMWVLWRLLLITLALAFGVWVGGWLG